MNTITLRPACKEDYASTERLVREAFWNQYTPGCSEHYLLHIMRQNKAFVPALDLVAVCDKQIVGSVVFMRAAIEGDDGTRTEVLTLGPVAVLPQYQRQGIGTELIERGCELAHEAGYRAVLLCGDPDFYLYQGFVPAQLLGIRTDDDMYASALHVRELHDGALQGISGRYIEDKVYAVDEKAAEVFDAQFPPKEKKSGTPSQQRFQELVVQRWPTTPKA